MTYKEIQNANTQTLLNEFKKYVKKEKDVEQQLRAISCYLTSIDYELTRRNKKRMDNNEPCIEEEWWKWRD